MEKEVTITDYTGLGAFEVSFEMLKLAEKNKKANIFLNAGRGNPNWINTKARLAFNRLIEFGIKDSLRTIEKADMAGYTTLKGIGQRFEAFLEPDDDEIDKFLIDVMDYIEIDLKLNIDDVIKEFIDGAIGNNYPVPSRCLRNTEIVLNRFMEKILYNGVHLEDKTQIFPTEGGTAAIVYIFNSLKRNKLVVPGDKIAINTPIFTPYLQLPGLSEFNLVETLITSDESDNWSIPETEIEKLSDPEIKAFFLVNPSNPGSKAFSQETLDALKRAVEKNPDLIIITDDVYGTFVQDFQSVYSVVPYNTILVYSFSKLFGATGWRLGLIAMQEDNVFDRLISKLDPEDIEKLDKRYDIVTHDTKELPFIERIVADSRSVGLYHTAGLSTPQQIMEVLFAFTHLIHRKEADPYFEACDALIDERYQDLLKAMKLEPDNSKENAKYYTLVDIYQLAEIRFGKKFRIYLEENFDYLEFLLNLADKNGVVLMDGTGFGASSGTLRISQANLPTEDYYLIGKQIINLLKEYYSDYLKKR
ncbi:bifunctional aspartate transaminase/aspartate 4-decarboxylase [Lactococcus petauri]|uniref:bifunctional aspartate transaminase/aspartate 4-decarboxylase n=1 Tax=Lactococcus petauri TaxID=1940789 RepID=UPI0022E0A085|nr:bifunctional aspartate transaminase/aspartate 4-decarboxylase [Lactococcus petauri]